MSRGTDSAGQPFDGRAFRPHPFAGDTGEADPSLVGALERFHALVQSKNPVPDSSHISESWTAVVDALRGARVLIPLIAEASGMDLTSEGVKVEKTQELSIIHVEGPDGRPVSPLFSDVASMAAWNSAARPIPVSASQAALAAASDGVTLMVINPGQVNSVTLRRSAVKAVATGEAYVPPYSDPLVLQALQEALVGEELWFPRLSIRSGDITHSLSGPEVIVVLSATPGLDKKELHTRLAQVSVEWTKSSILTERVDGLGVKVVSA
jgi:hypothetical protein